MRAQDRPCEIMSVKGMPIIAGHDRRTNTKPTSLQGPNNKWVTKNATETSHETICTVYFSRLPYLAQVPEHGPVCSQISSKNRPKLTMSTRHVLAITKKVISRPHRNPTSRSLAPRPRRPHGANRERVARDLAPSLSRKRGVASAHTTHHHPNAPDLQMVCKTELGGVVGGSNLGCSILTTFPTVYFTGLPYLIAHHEH